MSCKRSSDYFPGINATVTVKLEKWATLIFRCSRAANSVAPDRIWPNFELIQALMYVIVTCKYIKDLFKDNWENVATPFFLLIVYGAFSANSAVSSRICQKFERLRAFIHVIITCKYEKDRIKNSREKVATPFFPL